MYSDPVGLYSLNTFVTLNNEKQLTWDNSRPFKGSVAFGIFNRFFDSETKTFDEIWVKCMPNSSTLSSQTVSSQFEIKENHQNCFTFNEFTNTEYCKITYKVSDTENDHAFFDMTIKGNLPDSGSGVELSLVQ